MILVDESGFYLLPGVVMTYGPKGQTPILRVFQTRDHLSVISGITPRGKLYTQMSHQALNCLDCVVFLMHLLRCVAGPLLVIWDGSPIHRGPEMRELLRQVGKTVHLEALPPYAPELNPDEGVWQHLKHVEMRNLCCRDLDHLGEEISKAVARLRKKPHLIQSFFAEAKLAI